MTDTIVPLARVRDYYLRRHPEAGRPYVDPEQLRHEGRPVPPEPDYKPRAPRGLEDHFRDVLALQSREFFRFGVEEGFWSAWCCIYTRTEIFWRVEVGAFAFHEGAGRPTSYDLFLRRRWNDPRWAAERRAEIRQRNRERSMDGAAIVRS